VANLLGMGSSLSDAGNIQLIYYKCVTDDKSFNGKKKPYFIWK
jgi:hypothetical protein